MTKETLGQHSLKNWFKKSESRDPIEIERELHKDYVKNVLEAAEEGKRYFNEINSERTEFFIEVHTKKEIIFGQRTLGHKYQPKVSCPTPFYDSTVYRYERHNDIIHLLWTIPDKETCLILKQNKLIVHPSEYGLLDFVLKFDDGTLLKLAKELNGEKEDSSELIKN
jgi:hypothetical protein